MEVASILIMLLGIVALVILYVMSRVARKDLPKKRTENISPIEDEHGETISSILKDHPATDGSVPVDTGASKKIFDKKTTYNDAGTQHVMEEVQLILFIAAVDNEVLYGQEILKAFKKEQLVTGEMGLFYRVVLVNNEPINLFSVANGVEPWTLVPEELSKSTTPGISVILNLPAIIDDTAAINDFVNTARNLATDLKAVLKNKHQQPFSEEDKQQMLSLI